MKSLLFLDELPEFNCKTLEVMRTAVTEMGLSARAHDKILRVARTIADLEAAETIQAHHVQEAINYRMLDRDIFS
jgi:magnesium chelatase family protein